MADGQLTGKVAVVTGGASGMGRAIALRLAGEGAAVAIGSLTGSGSGGPAGTVANLPPDDALEAVREEIAAAGPAAFAHDLDVTDDARVDAFLAAATEALGPADILVNAAGITAEQTVCDHPDPLWMKVIDVNLHGTYRMIKRCLPGMIERGWGRVVNIASTAAQVGAVTSGAYCASKAGVVGLTRCVALEGAPHGVTCNAISPGWVETDFGRKWMGSIAADEGTGGADDYMARQRAGNPQGRLIQPDEVAALAVFLCRDEARGMTMQDLTLSGGALW